MSENLSKTHSSDDEIDLRELFSALWRGKWIILATTFVFAVAAIFYALSLPNIYKSEALLAPSAEQKSNGLSGQLGGLAAIAGVSLGGSAAVNKTMLAIEILKSRQFIGRFIANHDLLVPLMATNGWDLYNDELLYDEDIYDKDLAKWVREVSKPKESKPSLQEAHKIFLDQLSVVQDQTTGLVKLSFEHYSPFIAAEWTELLVADLNYEMKNRDVVEAQASISYLQQQIKDTNLEELRSALYTLIEEQTKVLMMASVRPEYAFKTVDSAIAPEEKSKPSRSIVCLVITILGGFLSIMYVVIRFIAIGR